MKHRIIFPLCAALCCAVFLQNVFAQDKSANTQPDGKTVLAATAQSQPGMRLASVNKIASENAKVTLVVEEGDPEYGYQILIDKDCNIYNIYNNGFDRDAIYAETDYSLPENASMSDKDTYAYSPDSITIEIPEGNYDYLVLELTPWEDIPYITAGDFIGSRFNFVGGFEYKFTVGDFGWFGGISTFSCDSPVDIAMTGMSAPASSENLTDAEEISATITNNGYETAENVTMSYTVNGVEVASEPLGQPLAPGSTVSYTFNKKADLSQSGTYIINVTAHSDRDALTADNSRTVKVIHAAAVPTPYTCTFDYEGVNEEWTTTGSYGEWTFNTSEGYAYLYEFAPDTYLATANPITLDTGTYHVAMDYNLLDTRGYEAIEIMYGKTNDVNKMSVLAKHALDKDNPSKDYTKAANFDVAEAGNYYFAVHVKSIINRTGIILHKFTVDKGVYDGTPDIVAKKVTPPYPGTTLGDSETVYVELLNRGTADIKSLTINSYLNGELHSTQACDVYIPIDSTKTVAIEKTFDFSAEGVDTVSVTISDVKPAYGDHAEEAGYNNSAASPVTHWPPTVLPLSVDFSEPEQRENWKSDASWELYDESYYTTMRCVGTTPLLSRGINLEAGKTYRLTYSYLSSIYYTNGDRNNESYDIIFGIDGTDIATEWDTIASYKDVAYQEIPQKMTIDFVAPEDGIYSVGIAQADPGGTLRIESASIIEVYPYDVRLSPIDYLPSKLPKEQADSTTIRLLLENFGVETVEGSVALTFNGEQAATASFDKTATFETDTVSLKLNLKDLPTGANDIEATTLIDGDASLNLPTNTLKRKLEITNGNILAYDYLDDNNWEDYPVYGFYSMTYAGMLTEVYKTATLSSITVGWGAKTNGTISISIQKYPSKDIDDNSRYIYLTDFVLPETTLEQVTEPGITEYQLPEALTLDAGKYMVVVGFNGVSLLIDNEIPGQLYNISKIDAKEYITTLKPITIYGTPVIRLNFDIATGIGAANAAGHTPDISYDSAGKTVKARSDASPITGLNIHSASGATVCSKSAAGQEVSFDASSLAPGVYIAKAMTAEGEKTVKFVVK